VRRLAAGSGLCLLVLLLVFFLVGGPADIRPTALPDRGPGGASEGARDPTAGEEGLPRRLLAAEPESREAPREADAPAAQGEPAIPAEPTETGGGVRWQTRHADLVTRLDVRLIVAESGREEWKDVPRSRFFAGLMSRSQALPPLWKGAVDPRRIEYGTRFYEVEGFPTGHYIIRLEDAARRFYVARVRVDRGRHADLGLLELEARSVRVRALDPAGNPIPEAACRLLFEEWVLEESRTAADGSVLFDPCPGTAVECRKQGFAAGRKAFGPSPEIVIELHAEALQAIAGPPGRWVFRGPQFTGEVGADGLIHVARRVGNREFLFVDPRDWSWRLAPYEDGKPVAGEAGCTFSVHAGGAPVAAGSIALRGAGRLFASSLEKGTARFEGIPAGRYGVVFRYGEQVHDNDHEYRFPDVDLAPGGREFHYLVPDLCLRLRVLAPDRSGLVVPVRIFGRGADEVSGAQAKIGSTGFTDHAGEVVFACLPRLLFMVSIQGKQFQFSPAEEWIEVFVR